MMDVALASAFASLSSESKLGWREDLCSSMGGSRLSSRTPRVPAVRIWWAWPRCLLRRMSPTSPWGAVSARVWAGSAGQEAQGQPEPRLSVVSPDPPSKMSRLVCPDRVPQKRSCIHRFYTASSPYAGLYRAFISLMCLWISKRY